MELNLRSWLQAARPAAQINLALPLVLGQLLAYKLNGAFSFAIALPLAYYSLAMHLYIVFWNDWADHQADRRNQYPTIFSGGSRVLPDGLLTPRDLFIAGALAVFLVLSLGVVFTLKLDRPWTLLLFGAGTFLLWAYSIPPLRLNYRGGGEILQGEFPLEFTSLHDLSIDYLLGILIQRQENDITAIQECIEPLGSAPLAQALAEESLGAAKGNLDSLQELVAAQADA